MIKEKTDNTGNARRQVFDRLRRRMVACTPEEFVRQMFVDYLIDTLGYPEGLMANEISITLNGMARRCDTVVFSRDRSPLMIVEYKAPDVAVTEKVFNQIARYNLVLKAPYLVVTNGRSCYCCLVERDGAVRFLDGVPRYADILTGTI